MSSESLTNNIAITIEKISKSYRIYDRPIDRLKQSLRKSKQYYREFWALRDISYTIKQGDTVGIIGRNGSGKSTLLQILCGTLTPSTGTVQTKGRIAGLLELGSGFNSEMSGRENVYLNALLHGLTRQETDARMDNILSFADIGEFIDQPVKTYSSGMMVRLAFSVITNVDADILIIDEALAVGDAFFNQKCSRFLRRFQERGTLLFVSHDTTSVRALCNRAILLNQGELIQQGSPREVSEYYLALQQGEDEPLSTEPNTRDEERSIPDQEQDWKDFRAEQINASTSANLLDIVQFDQAILDSESFGSGDAQILHVRLCDAESGKPCLVALGGEYVSLVIEAKTLIELQRPVVGFLIKDKNGQVLLGDNTDLALRSKMPHFPEGSTFRARFTFYLPLLPAGDYSVTVAVQEGESVNAKTLCWVHDTLILRSECSSVGVGLAGLPMKKIELEELFYQPIAGD